MNLVSMPISQLATVQSGGGAPQDGAAFTRTGFPFIRAGSLPKLLDGAEEGSLELIEPEIADKYGLKLFPAGTVLFAKSGMSATKGHVYRLRTPAYVVNHLAALVPHDESDSAFLAHALQRYPPTILIKDAAYPSIRLGDIESMRVHAPTSPGDRERIAEILDKVDALRAKRRTALARLDTVTQSIFLDMFGDPVTNPKGWPTVRLGDLCTRITDGTHQPPKWSETGNPFLFVSNVISGELTFDTAKFISDETHVELTRRCPIEVGDVLYSTVGSYGVPALVRTERRFAFQRHIAHLKPDRSELDPEFLRVMLASPPLRRQADSVARGIAQKTVNLADIREFMVFKPPLDVQRELASSVTRVEAFKAMHRKAIGEFDGLFASIQHRSFSGEL